MQSLLRWSLENSGSRDDGAPQTPKQPVDPGIIDAILGRPDAELMKEKAAVACDATRLEDERVQALDDLEMLIEQIDNANNLQALNLWTPLQALLTAHESTGLIKVQTLWVIGTAVQNNPAAQEVYLTYHPLSTLLSFLDASPESSSELRSKALYALSGLLRHNAPAVEQLNDGWARLRDALKDPDIVVRRKSAVLLGTLIIPEPGASTPPAGTAPSAAQQPTTPAPSSGGEALRLTFRPAADIDATQPRSTATSFVEHPNPSAANMVHANSHAGHLLDPKRTATSEPALRGFAEYHVVDTLVDGLVRPLPFGVDGDMEMDEDFIEKLVHVLYVYGVVCKGKFSEKQISDLRLWVNLRPSEAVDEIQELAKHLSL